MTPKDVYKALTKQERKRILLDLFECLQGDDLRDVWKDHTHRPSWVSLDPVFAITDWKVDS